MDLRFYIDKLEAEHTLRTSEWKQLLDGRTPQLAEYLFEKSRRVRIQFYGYDVYIRGLIEFTNYCKNNCYYCGIRSGNPHARRYRLTPQEILSCCEAGYALGFRTFVLQGGEDPYYTTDRLSDLVYAIRTTYPDCAITLSTGEATKKKTSSFLMPELIVFSCAMRHTILLTTRSFIPHICWLPTDSSVSGI